MTTFDGKIAVVTGAGSGIGKAIAQRLHRFGAHVVMSDIDADTLGSAAREIGDVETAVVDVSDANQVEAWIEGVASEHGRIDLLFNNAGMGVIGEVRDLSLDDWKRVIDVNLYGVVHGVAAAYPRMVKQGFGHIVNTASLGGLVPLPAGASYAAAKFGVVGLSLSLRLEAEPLGIKVSCVCPAAVETEIDRNAKWINVDRDHFLKSRPGKPMQASKCARIILKGMEKNRDLILPGAASAVSWTHRYFPFLTRQIGVSIGRKLREVRDENLQKKIMGSE